MIRELNRRCAAFEAQRQRPPFIIAWFWLVCFMPKGAWTAHGVDVQA